MSKPSGGEPGDTDTPPAYSQQPQDNTGADAGGYYPPAGQAPQQPYPAPASQAPHQPYPAPAGQALHQYPPQGGQYPVITGQPVPGQHVQQVRIPLPYPQNLVDWDTGLGDCMEDAMVCMYGYLCGWCLVCDIMKELDESQCFACLSPHAALSAARTKLRLNYGINGDLFGDSCAALCCFSCTACQLKRQIKIHRQRKEAASQFHGATA